MAIDPDLVDVWRVPLDSAVAELPTRLRTLSSEERSLALKLVREQDRARFVMVRSIVRQLIGRFVGSKPSSVSIEYGPAGKPRLASASRVKFNVSHSENLALIAITLDRELGVDVEFRRPPTPAVPEQVFSQAEFERIRGAMDPVAAFYDHWTLKEALLKGLGTGFTEPESRASTVLGCTMAAANFQLRTLSVAADYSAALATECVVGKSAPRVFIRSDF